MQVSKVRADSPTPPVCLRAPPPPTPEHPALLVLTFKGPMVAFGPCHYCIVVCGTGPGMCLVGCGVQNRDLDLAEAFSLPELSVLDLPPCGP